ncbi:MAG: VIT family protein [Planctomycetales bacterium]|nr:VIT family protein [Planctomycetales bacterium]
MMMKHEEKHRGEQIGWLRAAVLGANDGILSVSSIVVGVASANSDHDHVMLAGVAGLTAGAMSMAAGEYVSVSSQADTESANRRREDEELRTDPASELEELAQIYVQRGLDEPLARQVAVQLTQKDALTTHLRDELGITDEMAARPLQAAMASAASFAVGAALPLIIALLASTKWTKIAVVATTLVGLALLGGLSASVGGAPVAKAATRVAFWGAVSMAVASAIGWLFGVSVG